VIFLTGKKNALFNFGGWESADSFPMFGWRKKVSEEGKECVRSILTMLAHPVKVVEVAADVVPLPPSAAVQHDAVLLAVVVVGLVLAPNGF